MKNTNFEVDLLTQVSTDIVKLEAQNEWYEFYQKQQLSRLQNDLKILLELCQKSSTIPIRILDCGCNPPFILSTLSKMGFDAVGLDLDPTLFSKSIKKLDLEVAKANIETEKIPFTDNDFDFIIFTEVFEHLRINPVHTVSELYRVLKNGGVMLLSTPNLYSLKGIYNFLAKGQAYSCCTNNIYDEFTSVQTTGFFGHIREYTFQEVSVFLKKIGFKSIKIIYKGGGRRIWTQPILKIAPFLKPNMMFLAVK